MFDIVSSSGLAVGVGVGVGFAVGVGVGVGVGADFGAGAGVGDGAGLAQAVAKDSTASVTSKQEAATLNRFRLIILTSSLKLLVWDYPWC